MEEKIILKAKTSQINNAFFCIIVSFFVFLPIYYFERLSSITINISEMLNSIIYGVDIPVEILSYIVSGCFIAFPVFLILWKILGTHLKVYTFTEERLKMEYGILNRKRDYIEYYRIKDNQILEPLALRIFNLSHYVIISTDRSHPLLKIKAVKNLSLYESEIRNAIELAKSSGKGREIDVV